jgi:hypothetical protein
MAFIDSCAKYLDEAQQRNFQKWPILGVFIWRETTGYKDRNTYQKEIDYMKSFLSSRLNWIDNQLQNTSAVVAELRAQPAVFSLTQNYPNPFNPSTAINYYLPLSSYVTVKIYDELGREVQTLVDEVKPEGNYTVKFDANSLPSGVYFCRLSIVPSAQRDLVPTEGRNGQAGRYSETKKLMLLK